MSPKLRTQVTRCCTFQHSTATDHMKWRPLLYRSPSRQPRQAIAPARYSNLKCVSRRRATLYIKIQLELRGNTHFVICEFSRGNKTFYRLQEKYKKCDTSPFTGEQETRYLAVYERLRNASARLSREKNKKCDISPLTREKEMRLLAVNERKRNAISRCLRERNKCDISLFMREVQEIPHLATHDRSTRNAISRRLRQEVRGITSTRQSEETVTELNIT